METIITPVAANAAPTTPAASSLPQQCRRRVSALGRNIYAVAEPIPSLPTSFPLAECREKIHGIVNAALKSPRGVIGLKASVGTGKTFCAIMQIKSLLRKRKGKRVLYLVPSTKLRDEIADEHFRDPETSELHPSVGIAFARSSDPGNPGYCAKYDIAKALGRQRHRVHKLLCPRCEHHDACPYRLNHDALRTKQVVLACHESYIFGDGDGLRHFRAVIIDENAMDALVEKVNVTHKDLEKWEMRGRQTDGLTTAARNVLTVLKRALMAGPADGIDFKGSVPLLSVMRAIDDKIADHLLDLCREIQPNPLDLTDAGLSKLERAWLHELHAGNDAPLFAVWDFVSALQRESQVGTPADSACWLIPGREGIHSIQLLLPRVGVIEQLKRRVTIFLDGTFPEYIMRLLIGEALQVYKIQAEEFTTTTLFTDSLRKPKTLEVGTWERAAVERLLTMACSQYDKPLVVTEKDMVGKLTIPANARTTYFRAGDSAGSNDFTDCDAVILVGHCRARGDDSVHLAAVLRRERSLRCGECAQAKLYDDFSMHAKVDRPLYGYTTDDGYGLVRETMYPVDEDARAIAISSYAEGIIQAIGRARPANPDRQDNPLPVFLLCGEPPAGIRIDKVTSLSAWYKVNDPEWLEAHPAPAGKPGGRSPAVDSVKAAEYRQRVSDEAMERCEAARQSLIARGRPASQRAVRAEVMVLFGKEPSARTVKKYFREIGG